jgi:hypothetical protein
MTYSSLVKFRGQLLITATLLGMSLQVGCSSDKKACPTSACPYPAVTLHTPTTVWPANGASPTISVCRGTKCISGQLDGADVGSMNNPVSVSFPFPSRSDAQSTGSDYAEVTITPTTTMSASLDISYFPIHEADDLADGDHYTVTLSNDGGASLTYGQTVTYAVSYPNGSECAPLCRSADVTLSGT